MAIVVAACGGGEDAGSATASPSTAGAANATGTTQVIEAAFVPTASGEDLDFNSLRGKDVLLWFWAPW